MTVMRRTLPRRSLVLSELRRASTCGALYRPLSGHLVVVGREAAGVAAAGRGVVARDQPQVVVRVEVDVARDVAARAAVVGDLEDLLLARQVQARVGAVDELEAAELEVALPGVLPDAWVGGRVGRRARRGRDVGQRPVALADADGRRGVVQVDPLVGGEVVVDRRAVEAVLGVGVDRDLRDHLGLALVRVVQAQLAVARGLDHAAVGEDVEADRLVEVRRSRDLRLLVVGDDRGAAVAVDGVGDAGRPFDRALEVLAGLGAGERVDAGVERAPALVVLAPGDRVVEAHRAARVGPLVDGGQHVRDAADVAVEVQVGVGVTPRQRQVAARGVAAVGDLDRRLRRRGRGALGARSEHVGQELPLGLGGDRVADGEEAAAFGEVGLERGLLGVAEHVAGGAGEDHGAVALEVGLREGRSRRR